MGRALLSWKMWNARPASYDSPQYSIEWRAVDSITYVPPPTSTPTKRTLNWLPRPVTQRTEQQKEQAEVLLVIDDLAVGSVYEIVLRRKIQEIQWNSECDGTESLRVGIDLTLSGYSIFNS